MFKENIVNPTTLKGKDQLSRMRELMGESVNHDTKNYVIELTKKGPDEKVYAIVREGHQYFIKVTDKVTNILAEDFKYIGGLQNVTSEAYPSYAKAIKHLNLKFINLNEAYGKNNTIDTFSNDNLITEDTAFTYGFATEATSVFADEDAMREAVEEETNDDSELDESKELEDECDIKVTEGRLKISKMISIFAEDIKKKSLDETKFKLKLQNNNPTPPVNNSQGGFGGYDEPANEPNSEPSIEPSNEPAPQESNNEKQPFEKEPFNAGVDASEKDDPKKFIEQLSGKLGQSLRSYSDESGQPDFKLEKFAINSVISATHTSEMPTEDKEDIIKKINSSGNEDNNENGGSEQPEENNGENNEKKTDESLQINEIFSNFIENDKTMIKNVLKENFACGCDDVNIDISLEDILNNSPEIKPAIKPSTKPVTTPSRRSKPYTVPIIPNPETSPKPKAISESAVKIEPKNNWWEKHPDTLLVDWYNGQELPKTLQGRKDAFIECANELNKKFPCKKGEIEKMLNNIS
jgi:hypothetical protein